MSEGEAPKPDAGEDLARDANAFMRGLIGGEVDAAAGATGARVLPPAGAASDGDRPKAPRIEVPGRGNRVLADFAKEMGQALKSKPLFRRENVIVTVEADTGDVKIMSPERFLTWVADYIVIFESVTAGTAQKRVDFEVARTMMLTTAKGCLASDAFGSQIRQLTRVNLVRMPVLRASGVPELLPLGYDVESQIFTIDSGIRIDEKMSLEKAKAIWDDYDSEFGYVDERSKSVSLTMAQALFGMGLQPVEGARMGFMVLANVQGIGKSLVAQKAITPSHGLAENTARAKEEELRKILDSVVLQGSPYLFFDNLKGHFENALVEGFMTTPVWRARVLGTQHFLKGKVCTILIITGNNLTVSPDLQRRMLQCNLFQEEFETQEKRHKRDLNPSFLCRAEVRSELLSALWAMIRHWYESGRPPAGTREKPFRIPGFADWSDIFGGIVQAAGYVNPLTRPKDEEIASPITLHQRRLVEILGQTLTAEKQAQDYTFQELIDCCYEADLFAWKLDGAPKRSGDAGNEVEHFILKSACASIMGLMFTKEMGLRIFTMPDGRRLRFRKSGEGRSKRYTVELVPASTNTIKQAVKTL